MVELTRRNLLGLIIAAPAVIASAKLMKLPSRRTLIRTGLITPPIPSTAFNVGDLIRYRNGIYVVTSVMPTIEVAPHLIGDDSTRYKAQRVSDHTRHPVSLAIHPDEPVIRYWQPNRPTQLVWMNDDAPYDRGPSIEFVDEYLEFSKRV